MPSKRQYDLVQNDDYDTRIPLHPEEAYHHGITFQAKYIGMLDVPRPTSRVEIVAAMRRIRYEFKAKGIKKKKVTIEVSVDGVRVTLRKKKKRKHWIDDGKSVLLNHPIYRIFYVSHDSQDLKIFSYIARDGASNVFKCAVFKSNKKSQAMRVVRTIGQAFEVCHKLSITAPENVDEDDQDTFTQDLLSDRLSDITSDKPKKDLSESASDKGSLPTDDCSLKDLENHRNSRIPPQLDLIPPPPTTNNRKPPLMAAETYSSPHSDALLSTTVNGGSGGGSTGGSCTNLPPAGTALSAHHELQLMREQLEQQTQQTQAAMAQLQLAREQLQAEQSARLEAQARTHQLLVHNRELLDHIAALVAHLQGGEKPGQQQTAPHMTMPQHQHQHQMAMSDGFDTSEPSSSVDSSPVLPPFGYMSHGLIENRAAVTSCLQPSSPLRTTFNPAAFPFGYAPGESAAFEAQLLQRLQTLTSYPAYHQSYYAPPFVSPIYGQQTLLNNNYTLQPPPQKKMAPQSPLLPRNSYAGTTSLQGSRLSPARNSEPRQLPTQYPNLNLRVSEHQTQNCPYQHQQTQNSAYQNQQYQTLNANNRTNDNQTQKQQYQQTLNQNQQSQHLRVQQNARQQRETTPVPQSTNERKQTQFIKPQAQMGTLTTTDSDGRMRVIVPVPSNSNDGTDVMMNNLRLGDDMTHTGPPVTRSKSEKVPNRSQLMAEVHRTTWARHTTK